MRSPTLQVQSGDTEAKEEVRFMLLKQAGGEVEKKTQADDVPSEYKNMWGTRGEFGIWGDLLLGGFRQANIEVFFASRSIFSKRGFRADLSHGILSNNHDVRTILQYAISELSDNTSFSQRLHCIIRGQDGAVPRCLHDGLIVMMIMMTVAEQLRDDIVANGGAAQASVLIIIIIFIMLATTFCITPINITAHYRETLGVLFITVSSDGGLRAVHGVDECERIAAAVAATDGIS